MSRALFILWVASLIFFSACEKFDLPTVNTPAVQNVIINSSVDIGFEIHTDAGYASSNATAEVGVVTPLSNIGENAVQAIIYIKYSAVSEKGIDKVTFTVRDKKGKEAISIVDIEVIENSL